jgi:hypothetical protein
MLGRTSAFSIHHGQSLDKSESEIVADLGARGLPSSKVDRRLVRLRKYNVSRLGISISDGQVKKGGKEKKSF